MQVTPGMSAMPDPHADSTALQGGQPMAGAIANGGAVPPRQSTATPHSAATAAAIAALQVRPVQPMQLPQQQQPVAAAVQPARPAAGGAAAAALPTGYGFTPAQLAMLRNQIMAFRRLKVTSSRSAVQATSTSSVASTRLKAQLSTVQ